MSPFGGGQFDLANQKRKMNENLSNTGVLVTATVIFSNGQ
jgi:hypothetical protein